MGECVDAVNMMYCRKSRFYIQDCCCRELYVCCVVLTSLWVGFNQYCGVGTMILKLIGLQVETLKRENHQ